MNVNKAIVVGRVTRDPELRQTQNGASVTSFSIATNQHWTDKQGQRQEKTEFHNIVLWGRIAEIAGQYIVKGQECCVEGHMQTREYEGKDGIARRITEIVGESFQLGQRPKGSVQDDNNYQEKSNASSGFSNRKNKSEKRSEVQSEDIPTIHLDRDSEEEIRVEDIPF